MATNTINYNLIKPDLSDIVDIDVINDNMDVIDEEIENVRQDLTTLNNTANTHLADYVRNPAYSITTGTENTYIVTLEPAITTYTEGMGIVVKINVANTGASTININGLGAKDILDSKGNTMTAGKLRLNGVYTLRYDGSSFILQGEGGETSKTGTIAGNNTQYLTVSNIGFTPRNIIFFHMYAAGSSINNNHWIARVYTTHLPSTFGINIVNLTVSGDSFTVNAGSGLTFASTNNYYWMATA